MPTTRLCTSTETDVLVRGRSLPGELLGNLSFTAMIHFHLTGKMPTPAQTAVLDAALVALMEHGLTPTAITARLTYTSAPEAMQGAVAAGLLSVGSLFVGTLEGCAELLAPIVASDAPQQTALDRVRALREAGRPIPGFGHPIHRPIDPRTPVLLDLARQHDLYGPWCHALEALTEAVHEVVGRPLPVNATGALAALLPDAGIPTTVLRGIALISRCAGLVGHIHEEQHDPTLRALWHAAEAAVDHEDPTEDE